MSMDRMTRIMNTLESPHVTEKVAMGSDAYQYAFKVAVSATKHDIKAAVEQLFSVTVNSVRVLNMKGKATRFGRKLGKRKAWKKAYVTLIEGNEIALAGDLA